MQTATHPTARMQRENSHQSEGSSQRYTHQHEPDPSPANTHMTHTHLKPINPPPLPPPQKNARLAYGLKVPPLSSILLI